MVVLTSEGAARQAVWLESGQPLIVLAVVSQSGGSKFLLWSNRQSTAALFAASDFTVVDGKIPTQWQASINLGGHVELSPKEWKADGFWEKFHEEDPEAERTFRVLADAIAAASES